jgi:HNH endonuclease
VHIGFRTSGGRGEYELVGSHSGYNALSLEGWSFHLRWPDGLVRDTGLVRDSASSGKPRLRSDLQPPFQIGRMVAAMLLLPDPRREFRGTGNSEQVASAKGYILSRVGFGPDTEFAPVTDAVTIDPSFITLENREHHELIGVEKRYQRIAAVYALSSSLPYEVGTQLDAHREFMATGTTVDSRLVSIVGKLARALQNTLAGYTADQDPLPALERMLRISPQPGPSLPPPDELGEEEPEVSARSAYEYRLAKARGAAGRQFSVAVRAAYRHRCAFCGAKYGGVPGVRSGVDAAHILAWSNYNLDVVSNGLSLCKLHHWAFDAALLLPVLQGGIYRLRFTTIAEQFESSAIALLGQDGFELPTEWLPADEAKRPSASYLQKLHADLAVTFLS